MTVTLKINPYSNRVVAPSRNLTLEINPYDNEIVAPKKDGKSVSWSFTGWTTDAGVEVTTDTGRTINFKQSTTTLYPLEIEIRPYRNRIVAPEKR